MEPGQWQAAAIETVRHCARCVLGREWLALADGPARQHVQHRDFHFLYGQIPAGFSVPELTRLAERMPEHERAALAMALRAILESIHAGDGESYMVPTMLGRMSAGAICRLGLLRLMEIYPEDGLIPAASDA